MVERKKRFARTSATVSLFLILSLSGCNSTKTALSQENHIKGSEPTGTMVRAEKAGSEALEDATTKTYILSGDFIDYNHDGHKERLILKMTNGKYIEKDDEPGPLSGIRWQGVFQLELIDEKGNMVSEFALNNIFESGEMVFKNPFQFSFDDYNGDSQPDFTIGQYSTSNGFIYGLFTVNQGGSIELLNVAGGNVFFSSNGGYSCALDKVDDKSFKITHYDNSVVKHFDTYFTWTGRQFEKTKKVESPLKEEETAVVIPKAGENLKVIEVENLNDRENSMVTLSLPENYTADKYMFDKSESFEYKAAKNRRIKKVYEYNLYNTAKKGKLYHYGIRGMAGSFATMGYYRDQQHTIFPNHSSVKSKLYSGKTVLGKGDIYLLYCDVSMEEITYEMIYVWIPIENEDLAYNLTLSVPIDEKPDEYVEMVKTMLGIK